MDKRMRIVAGVATRTCAARRRLVDQLGLVKGLTSGASGMEIVTPNHVLCHDEQSYLSMQ